MYTYYCTYSVFSNSTNYTHTVEFACALTFTIDFYTKNM